MIMIHLSYISAYGTKKIMYIWLIVDRIGCYRDKHCILYKIRIELGDNDVSGQGDVNEGIINDVAWLIKSLIRKAPVV